MTTAQGQDLQLPFVPFPSRGDSGTRVMYGSASAAVNQLCDHLLTKKESEAWATIMPALHSHVDIDSADARYGFAQQIKDRPAKAQGLLNDLASLLIEEITEAKDLGWFKGWSPNELSHSESNIWAQSTRIMHARPVTVAFSTSGVLVLFELVMATVFIPGQGNAEAIAATRGRDQEDKPLRRERGMRRLPPKGEHSSPYISAQQKVFFDVFRPAVQFLRSLQHLTVDFRGNPVRTDYALIKEVLPAQSRLKFEAWQKLRQARKVGVS